VYGFSYPRWFTLGVAIGLTSIVLGNLAVKRPRRPTPPASPVLAGDAPEGGEAAPGLRIECRNDAGCVKASESDWNDGRGPLRRKFLRVQVYNDGPSAVDGCRVTLRDVTEVTPGGVRPTEYDGPRRLVWSGDRAAKAEGRRVRSNADPGVADLFYTVHHPSGDEILLKDEGYSDVLKFGRWYIFEVEATANNAAAVGKRIKVRFGQTWDAFEVVRD